MINNITFGANFIQKMPIKKYSAKDKNYTLSYASLVELNPHDINDVKALDEIAFNFGNDSYVDNIALDIKRAYKRNNQTSEPFSAIVLTKQTDNFEHLKAKDVIGTAEISKIKNGEIELVYLQANPQFVYSFEPRQIKNIGTSILDYLKQVNNKIRLISSSSSINFYLKNKFKMVSLDSCRMIWEKKLPKQEKKEAEPLFIKLGAVGFEPTTN